MYLGVADENQVVKAFRALKEKELTDGVEVEERKQDTISLCTFFYLLRYRCEGHGID